MFKTWDSLAHLLIVTRTLSQLAKITSVGIWTRQECQEVGGIIIVTPLLFHHTSSSSYNIHTYTGVLVCFRALPFYMNALLTDAQTHTHTHTHISEIAQLTHPGAKELVNAAPRSGTCTETLRGRGSGGKKELLIFINFFLNKIVNKLTRAVNRLKYLIVINHMIVTS